ncbi:MAG TPA: DUF58 domain-containing protein [Thermoanaerobaculia bacterium]|nr:DUF58 domain-containing protein [Thermoanaerobaculia bacterium]
MANVPSSARFIDPSALGRIGSLDLLAKTVVEGFISGLHRSPFLGRSMDFAEYRAYMPGDDIRQIDWKLFSRTDRFYVKEFEGDTNTNVVLALDVSRSMDFGTVETGAGTMTKLDYGRYLAASLGYFASRQRDRIGLMTFDSDVVDIVPPAAKHLDVVLHTIDRVTPGGAGKLTPPMFRLGTSVRRRGFVVVISDFYEAPDDVVRAVQGLRVRGNDLILFHLLDPAEIDFPYDEPSDFADLETGTRVAVSPEAFREQYRKLILDHIETLQKRFVEIGIDYVLVNTSEPLDAALYRYLASRLWAMKSR